MNIGNIIFIKKSGEKMDRYYYHGVGEKIEIETLEAMLTIMDTGMIKSRGAVGYSGDEYEHVCLYRKNEDHNYTGGDRMGTAYEGWINHAFCFIISPSVEAFKTGYYHDLADESDASFTDLIDEWRSDGEISLERVVGIGLPLDEIRYLRAQVGSSVDEEFDDKLADILLFAESMDWMVVNSDEADFADRLDDSLNVASDNKCL